MKKMNTSPISGAAEFTPPVQATFNYYKQQIERAYHLHGFLPVETPVIERTEILLAKAGGDTEKQIYKVVKTAEAADEADQALRFDHTVPLARYVVKHQQQLTFPFKAAQTGFNYRGERAQRGRFREFCQCDIDVIGRGELPIAYDAEVIATFYDALKVFDLPEVVIRISNRQILAGFVAGLGLSAQLPQIASIIDHAEKFPREKTLAALQKLNLSAENVVKITTFMDTAGPWAEVKPRLMELSIDNAEFAAGLAELDTVMSLLAQQGLEQVAIADMLIVRGLDYYTGTVFECFVPSHKEIGAIGGGGRYANLASNFSNEPFPGVGGSIGLSRLFFILNEYQLLKYQVETPVDVAVVPISEAEYPAAFALAERLRAAEQAVDVVLTSKRLGDKLTYAAKVAKGGVVVGSAEAESGQYQLKDFATGQQTPLEV